MTSMAIDWNKKPNLQILLIFFSRKTTVLQQHYQHYKLID
jgi:hypothetical protein